MSKDLHITSCLKVRWKGEYCGHIMKITPGAAHDPDKPVWEHAPAKAVAWHYRPRSDAAEALHPELAKPAEATLLRDLKKELRHRATRLECRLEDLRYRRGT